MANESGKVSLSKFPSTTQEALAFLFVQSRDLSDKTPEDIAEIYHDAFKRIGVKRKEIAHQK